VLERGIGYGLPFVALALALLLLVGLAVRVAAAVSAALFLLLLVGLVAAAARGLRIACGCLGSGGVLPTGQATSYPRDIAIVAVLLVLAAGLAWWPQTRYALDDTVRRSAESGGAYPRPAVAAAGQHLQRSRARPIGRQGHDRAVRGPAVHELQDVRRDRRPAAADLAGLEHGEDQVLRGVVPERPVADAVSVPRG
jgi:hypothetical protein